MADEPEHEPEPRAEEVIASWPLKTGAMVEFLQRHGLTVEAHQQVETTRTPGRVVAPRAWVEASLPERAGQVAMAFASLRDAGMPDDEAGVVVRMLVQVEQMAMQP